jgi:tetratricopeptide (TPR) repeat protein
MLRKEMTKLEIERELAGKGDYVLIDNITRFLKENLPTDIRRFAYAKLCEIYEKRKMFADAADLYGKTAELSTSDKEKVDNYIRETECYIKAGFFDKADNAIRKIIGEAKVAERGKIMISIKEFYKDQARIYEKEKRRSLAAKTYEKILSLNISDAEKEEINQHLTGLYKELGMVKQYMGLKKEYKKV